MLTFEIEFRNDYILVPCELFPPADPNNRVFQKTPLDAAYYGGCKQTHPVVRALLDAGARWGGK